MSGLPREAPCVKVTDTDQNICPVSTKDVLLRLKNESLIFPPWSVPSYRLIFKRMPKTPIGEFGIRMPKTLIREFGIHMPKTPMGCVVDGVSITAAT